MALEESDSKDQSQDKQGDLDFDLWWAFITHIFLAGQHTSTNLFILEVKIVNLYKLTLTVETVQDFLIKLDVKPLVHLLKISIFSLNNDVLRLPKIMNNHVKDCKIRTFKVIFHCLKLVESFQNKICEEYLIRRPTYINKFFWKLWYLKYFI